MSAPSPVTGVAASKRYLSRAEKEERRGVEIVSVTHTGDGYEMDDRKEAKHPRERELYEDLTYTIIQPRLAQQLELLDSL